MDGDGNYKEKECPHGRCLNHGPRWEDIGERFDNNPTIFGAKTWWRTACCGKKMARVKKISIRKCRQCGRREEFVADESHALCKCCGHKFHKTSSVFDLAFS